MAEPLASLPDPADTDATIYAFRRNIVVAASAGTGKTYRLTALYVLLNLGLTSLGQRGDETAAEPIGPERIVATTFSRAAAQEIATRVERALSELAQGEGEVASSLLPVIEARREKLAEPISSTELRRRAAEALARFPAARIDTLHGVASRIVRRNALAIGLPPNARVLEEEEAQAIGDAAVDEALSAALSGSDEEREAARALIVTCGGVSQTRKLVLRLIDRLDEEGRQPSDLVLPDHEEEARLSARELGELARRVVAMGSPTFRSAATNLAHRLTTLETGSAFPEEASLDLIELFATRMPARSKRLAADDELDDYIGAISGKTKGEKAKTLIAFFRSAKELRQRELGIQRLLEDARARLLAHKRREGALGFGDLLRIARDTLRDRREVARAVRDEVGVLLVDEFQDTSRVQRDLVYLMHERDDAAETRPLGALPGPSALKGHGLFLVGDRKQSIYGFRGADVAVFSRIATDLAGDAAREALSIGGAPTTPGAPIADFIALRESRRSGRAILDFVNAFSARDFASGRDPLAKPRPFEITYSLAEHLTTPEGGKEKAARVVLLEDDGTSPENADPIVRESQGAAREAHVAAAFIHRLTRQAAPDEHRFSFKEIALLARRRSTIPLIELALARLEIPYVVAGRALFDTPEVRDAAALLRLLLDGRDRLAMASVLRGPMVALSDTSLAILSLAGRGLPVQLLGALTPQKPGTTSDSFAKALGQLPSTERTRLETFRSRYREFRRAALRLPPGDAVRAAITTFELDRVLAALPRAEARIGNLDRLVMLARRRGGTLAAFVRWLDRRMRDEADEAEAAVFSAEDDAVRLTTIHASKGLDFPAVILVDQNAEARVDPAGLGFVSDEDGPPTLMVRHYVESGEGPTLTALQTGAQRAAFAEARAREHAERRRLSYVAVTRPKELLAIVSVPSKPRPGSALGTIADGREQGDLDGAFTTIEPASPLLALARPAASPPKSRAPVGLRCPPRPDRSPARIVALPVEAAELFLGCPRRFRLRHLLGLDEPKAPPQLDLFGARTKPKVPASPPPRSIEPDSEGSPPNRLAGMLFARTALTKPVVPVSPMHEPSAAAGVDAESARIRAGLAQFLASPYAKDLEGAEVLRDVPTTLKLETSPRRSRPLVLEGRIDLLWKRQEEIEVVELGLETEALSLAPRLDAHGSGLRVRAMALSVAGSHPDVRVRAGVWSTGRPAPEWLRGGGPMGSLSTADLDAIDDSIGPLGDRIADSRHRDEYEGVPPARCKDLGCGFASACHGKAS